MHDSEKKSTNINSKIQNCDTMKLLVLIYSLLFFEELTVHVPVYIIEGLLTILKGYIKGGLPFDRLLNNDKFWWSFYNSLMQNLAFSYVTDFLSDS